MSISFDDFKAIIGRIKDALLEKPKTKLFIEDIARAAQIDVKTAEAVYDFLLDLDAMLFDIEVDREIRGKFIRYYPDDDDGDDGDEFEGDEDVEGDEI
jgi:hypothetical protein